MLAFLQSRNVDHVSGYCQRGRTYQRLSDEDLTHSWKSVWHSLEIDPLNEKLRDTQADLSAEFSIRGREPPWSVIRRQLDTFVAASDRAHKKWLKENPTAAEAADQKLYDDFQNFLEVRKKSN